MNNNERKSLDLPSPSSSSSSNYLIEKYIEIVFLLLGIGVLIPWNFFISPKSYFQSRLCGGQEGGMGGGGENIELWFSILYNGGSVISLAFVMFCQYFCDYFHHQQNNNNNQSQILSRIVLRIRQWIIKTSPYNDNNSGSISSSSSSSSSQGGGYAWHMVMVPLAIYLVVFIITTVLVFLPSLPPELFLMLTFVGLFICGVCTSVAQAGIVGTAGLFQANIGITPYFNGQAVGGLVVSIANFVAIVLNDSSAASFLIERCAGSSGNGLGSLVTTTTTPTTKYSTTSLQQQDDASSADCVPYSDISWPTALYFILGCLVLAACMIGYQYVDQYERHTRKHDQHRLIHTSSSSDQRIIRLIDNNSGSQEYKSTNTTNETNNVNFRVATSSSSIRASSAASSSYDSYQNTKDIVTTTTQSSSSSEEEVEDSDSAPLLHLLQGQENVQETPTTDNEYITTHNIQTTHVTQQHKSNVTTLSIWRAVRGPAISLFWTYFVTLALFPVWTSELSSTNQCRNKSRIWNDLFSPLSFVIFNLGDLLGRMISSKVEILDAMLSTKLVFASIVRFVFFALFLFCHAVNSQFQDIVIESDVFSWFIQLCFAISNGILTNVAFCYAPQLVENEKHPQQVASAILNFSLCFGLLCGSFFSFPFLQFAVGE